MLSMLLLLLLLLICCRWCHAVVVAAVSAIACGVACLSNVKVVAKRKMEALM